MSPVLCPGFNCVLQNSCLPRTCEYEFIWKQGLLWIYEVKISYWIMVDPKSNMTSVIIRREKVIHRDTDTWEECHVTTDAEIEVMHLQVKEHQGLLATKDGKRGKEGPSLEPSEAVATLISDSGLQTCGTTHFSSILRRLR